VNQRSEAYWDIVWRQFKKNRNAYWALWLLVPLFLLAIFAPVVCSDQPYVFFEDGQALYPWIRALFNQEEPVDYLFNMALLAFFPWLAGALGLNSFWKRRGMPGRRRLALGLSLYLGLTTLTCILFSLESVRPKDKYAQRSFAEEEARNKDRCRGVYPPIPFGPITGDTSIHFQPPRYRKPPSLRTRANDNHHHWLGTDNNGRDVLVRMIYGLRLAMTVGFFAVGMYVTIGVVIGAVAGYFGGRIDMLIMRVIEVVMLFPTFFLILTLVAFIGQSIYIVMFAIGITNWPTIARLIRGEVLKQRTIDYVVAARALGASHFRVIFKHVLPNAIAPALVSAPFGVASAIIVEAGLSLLGFGVRPPAPSWGALLSQGHANYHYWWLIVVPSLAIFVCVTLFNLVGSGLRDAMDPRLRK
jgi:peptide/nickel transport system permease protein